MTIKRILSLLALFLALMACTKEEYKEVENYTLPSITMDSCVVAWQFIHSLYDSGQRRVILQS